MNPQPEPYVGNLVAFVLFCMVVYFFWKNYNTSNNHIDFDKFTLGYIEESTPTINIINQSKPNFEDQPIYTDCIDALHALGMKKSEAKRKTKQIFSSLDNPPSSIQDFLMIALKK